VKPEMRFNINLKVLISTIGSLFLFSLLSSGQIYSFVNYGTERNIPNGYVYTIIQSKDGFLWVGTGNGLTRFDGYKFFQVQYPDSSVGRYPTKCLKDKLGTLWFGCSDGAVLYEKENKLISVPVPNTRSISELIEGPDGLIYVIPQGKTVFSINPLKPEEVHKYSVSVEQALLSASFTKSGNLLIGTQENLLVCRLEKDSISVIKVIKGIDSYGVTSIHKIGDGSRFIIGTDDNGIFQLTISGKADNLSRFPNQPEFNSLKVQSITEGSEGSFWVSTSGSGVIQFDMAGNYEKVNSVKFYDINSGLTGNDVKTVFQDIDGNYWFGLFGEGISMLASNSLSYYAPGKNPGGNNILYIKNFENNYILGTPDGFYIFNPVSGKSHSFTDLDSQVGHAEIKSFYLDNEKNLWIGTGGKGLYVRNNSGSVRQFYRSGDSGADDIKDIEMDAMNIWLATTNGVIILDKKGNLEKKFDINNGLPHNSINKILLTRSGVSYIGTESDKLYKIDLDFKITAVNGIMSGSTRNRILSFTQTKNGAIWAATEGNGIFKFFKDSVSVVTRANDLMSNYCYSILADQGNNIWVGHNKGFSRFNSKTGTVRIFGTDFAKNGVCNTNGMFESADNKIFIGTTEGLVIYDRLKDMKSSIGPFNNINTVEINDISYPYQPSFVLPYKKYKIKVLYSGINFSAPEKVYYSSFLDNFDIEWSKMNTSREALYSLGDGKYKFSMISVNEDGFSRGAPVSFDILIKKPFYRTWWAILSELSVLTGIVILIIRERDKSQKKIQEYLEKELAARTSVVMKQKGEIELQNIEITDSINYAKRIQTSILPDINKLKDCFKDAFILFHPRDIVSGDFYWFDKLEEDKFILVCADSTGHGVPGAFMSMIGSTLLQDIVTRKRISKPSEILSLLDKQIFSTLNQNVELGVSNDGMDMVVCEFSLSTRHIRFASAMRPVILVLDGEPFYIKGNRSSVGGESVIEKFFDDQEYYLKEGDTIYLFSDGLPDQFGGPDGKKLKIARLKRMIEQISKLPMDEQKVAMAKFYFDWKGSYDQVDDVLLMGVKV
jgi:ligand-binding sensor domain-containing protein/serine phosphatase RsbU (regulator of sigma subunit)